MKDNVYQNYDFSFRYNSIEFVLLLHYRLGSLHNYFYIINPIFLNPWNTIKVKDELNLDRISWILLILFLYLDINLCYTKYCTVFIYIHIIGIFHNLIITEYYQININLYATYCTITGIG